MEDTGPLPNLHFLCKNLVSYHERTQKSHEDKDERRHHSRSRAAAPVRAPALCAHGHGVRRHSPSPAPLRPLAPGGFDHPPTPLPPGETCKDGDWLKAGITCEPGEPGDALGDWEPLQIRRELHLHDAGHALQHHPHRQRPLPPVRAALRPSCRAYAESGSGPRASRPGSRGGQQRAVPGALGGEVDPLGADWQRASDVRAPRTPRGCARPRGAERRECGSERGPRRGLGAEGGCCPVGPFASVDAGDHETGCCA